MLPRMSFAGTADFVAEVVDLDYAHTSILEPCRGGDGQPHLVVWATTSICRTPHDPLTFNDGRFANRLPAGPSADR